MTSWWCLPALTLWLHGPCVHRRKLPGHLGLPLSYFAKKEVLGSTHNLMGPWQ